MRIGDPLPSAIYDHWSFIEDDPIAKQVTDYDRSCKLAVNRETGQLGLAREVGSTPMAPAGLWVIAAAIDDKGGNPIKGAPDGRVLEAQRRMDVFRLKSSKRWHQKVRDDQRAEEAKRKEAFREELTEMADQMVFMEHSNAGGQRPVSLYLPKKKRNKALPRTA